MQLRNAVKRQTESRYFCDVFIFKQNCILEEIDENVT